MRMVEGRGSGTRGGVLVVCTVIIGRVIVREGERRGAEGR